jgi:hypothetical protein
MGKRKFLKNYSGQTTDELLALEGEYRKDSLIFAFEAALEKKAARVGQKGLTDPESIVLAVKALESEVNNGGYDQFFFSSSKKYTPIIVEALRRVGCKEAAKLTQQAIDILGIEGPIKIDAIDRSMDRKDDLRDRKLAECDERYYEIAGDLVTPLFEFIKKNRGRIKLND